MTTDTRTAENSTGIRRFIPILSWLPRYDRSWLTVDIIAGLTLWGLVVPEAMARRASSISRCKRRCYDDDTYLSCHKHNRLSASSRSCHAAEL